MRIAPITRIKLLRVLLYCLYCEVAQLTNSLQGTARSAEFVLRPVIHGSGASGPGGGFPQIDDPRFSVVADGQSRRLRRTWLDTFDWRLFRAGLTADMPAALAVCTVLTRLFDTAQANVPGAIRDIDTEFLHDLRIAVRRTRSVLKLAGSVLPAALVGRYRPEFKWLGDLTTPTRDLDVYLLGYPQMARKLVAGTEPELHPFHEYLGRQRAAAQRQLARGLRSARFNHLASRWRHDLEQAAAAPRRQPAAGRFAAGRIARAYQRVLRDGGGIEAASPPQALHDLRKRCKELRYLLEVFASLHDPAEQWRAVNELKALQDCLGEFQDTEVQQAELRAFAGQMMADRSAPAETLLAMGEIAAALAAAQRAARGEFAGRFADFASARGQARIAALTGAAS